MARLTHSDLEAVLRVAQEVSRARTRDEFSRVAVTELAELVRSDVLALNEVDPSAGRISYIAEPESFAPPRELNATLMELADEHPLMRYYALSGDGSAKRVSDFWTQEQFHTSSIYQRVYRHIGVEYQMSLALPRAQAAGRRHGRDPDAHRFFRARPVGAQQAPAAPRTGLVQREGPGSPPVPAACCRRRRRRRRGERDRPLRSAVRADTTGVRLPLSVFRTTHTDQPVSLPVNGGWNSNDPSSRRPIPWRCSSLCGLGRGKPRRGSVTSPRRRITRVRCCSERSRPTSVSSKSRRSGSRHVRPRSSGAWSMESPTPPSVKTCICPRGP